VASPATPSFEIAAGKRPPFPWWEYRQLLYLLVRLEFVAKVKQTALGPAWFVLQPLAMAGMFVGVFTRILPGDSDGAPPLLFYFSGLIFWGYFSQTVSGVATSLTTYAGLFRKVYFPRLVIPLSIAVAKAIPAALQLACFLVLVAVTRPKQLAHLLAWLPLGIAASSAILAAAAIGLGLAIACASIRYRDLQHGLGFLLQLGLYASPVIYSPSHLAEPYRSLLFVNPVAGPIELMRSIFFDTPLPARGLAISACIAAACLLVGLDRFDRAQGGLVDVL
jgi:lipopolysaccharide transport system permease protein